MTAEQRAELEETTARVREELRATTDALRATRHLTGEDMTLRVGSAPADRDPGAGESSEGRATLTYDRAGLVPMAPADGAPVPEEGA